MKKTLAIILALALVFSSFTFAFAEEVLPVDAKAVAGLGMLVGAGNGVTLDYLKTAPTRIQSAIMVLRLKGLEADAKAFKGTENFADVKNAQWAAPIMAYLKANPSVGFVGTGGVNFEPNAKTDATSYYKVMLETLGYKQNTAEVVGDFTYAETIAFAAKNGLTKISSVLNFTVNDLATATIEALKANVKGSTKTLAVSLVDAKVITEAAAVAAGVYTVAPTNLEVVSVKAMNLKEAEVVFTKAVDKTTAENTDAYALKQGLTTLVVSSAKVLEGGKTVRLSLASSFVNQTEAELAVTAVKAAEGTQVLTVKELKFTPVDVTAPAVEKVESLGNKAIKITFSEPVTMAGTVAGNFKINDLVVSGTPTISGRTITIQLFSTLASGEHTLAINNQISDIAGIQLVSTSLKLAVVADAVAPIVAAVQNATLEGVTVVYSEDVQDTEAMLNTNYYWMQSTTKKTATSVEKVDGKTFKVYFTTNNLPGYTTELYVINVKDYSSNVIAAGTKVVVSATLDQTRPEILTSTFDGVAKNKMTLTLTKNITASSFAASNVKVKKADGTVVANGYTATVSGKIVVVAFANAVTTAGTYTFEVAGLTDATLLKNAMLPYTTEFVVKNTTAPTAGTNVTGSLPNYIITFSKAMDTTTTYSIINPANYYVTYNTSTVTGITGNLPAGTNLVPTPDNKGVIVTFPSGVLAVTKLVVQGVKDTSGNFLSGYAKEYTVGQFVTTLVASDAKATGTKTVMVKFNQPVGAVSMADFAVSGANTVTNAVVDSSDNTLVKLTLGTAIATNAGVTVTATASVNTLGITGAQLASSAAITVKDAIAPTIVLNANDEIAIGAGIVYTAPITTLINPTIVVTFTENIKAVNSTDLDDNFLVYRGDGIQLTYGLDYTVAVTGANALATITLTPGVDNLTNYVGTLHVAFDNTNENVIDTTGDLDFNSTTVVLENVAAGFDTRSDFVSGSVITVDVKKVSVVTPLAAQIAIGGTATVTFSEAVNATSLTAVQTAISGGQTAGTLAYAWNTGNTILTITNTVAVTNFLAATSVPVLNVQDAVGNVTATMNVIVMP